MSALDISLDIYFLRQASETYDRHNSVVEDATTVTTWYGRGWLNDGINFTNYSGIMARELFDNFNIEDGGSGWAAAGINFTNYGGIKAYDDFDDQNINDGGFGWTAVGINFTNA